MSVSDVLRKVEQYRKTEQYTPAFETIKKIIDSTEIEVQYVLAQLCWESCNRHGAIPSERDGCLRRLEEHLEANPTNADTYRSLALLIAIDKRPVLSRDAFEQMDRFKTYVLKAIQYNPHDGFAHYLLGMYCFEVANAGLQWNRLAAMIVKPVPTATVAEALSHFQKAEKLMKGNNSGCLLMAAQCLFKLGRKAEATDYLRKCIAKEDEVQSKLKLNTTCARTVAGVQNVVL